MISQEVKKNALNYELEYSKAYSANVEDYGDFVHIKNKFVNYAGDFNRGIHLKLSNFDDFDKVVTKINEIHSSNGLEKPSNFYIYPPKLDKLVWEEYLATKNYELRKSCCMIREVSPVKTILNFSFTSPSYEDYFKWHYELEKGTNYFNQDWYNEVLPATKAFIREFKPYWLVRDNNIIGWVYCQFNGEICNIYDVWIEEAHRGKGLSRIMFDFINNEAILNNCKYLNLFAFENRKVFYEKLNFNLYEEVSIIQTIS